MLEGGGKTPILSPNELEELGFKIVAYPLSLIGCSIRAMEVLDLDMNMQFKSIYFCSLQFIYPQMWIF